MNKPLSSEVPPSLGAGSMPTVLFVDDEPHVTANFRIMFRKEPFKVLVANSGAQALELMATSPVDIVVSDEQMPDMPGSVLLAEARRLYPETVRVILTGEASLDAAIAAINHAGIFRFLRKPCAAEELLACLREAAHAREAQRRAAAVEQDTGVRRHLSKSFALALEALFVVAQPVISISQRGVFAYEILARTREPSVPHAGAFFAAAEELGRVRELDRAIRKKIAEILPQLPEGSDLLINLHPDSLDDPELLAEDSPLLPYAARIIYEITERSDLHSLENARAQVTRMRALGYRIAVDDLGAGYAGLSSIALLQPEIVKIDMGLVRGVDTSATQAALISSVIALCAKLDILVIAEGVETAAELARLMELECDLLQGYYFARPAAPFCDVTWRDASGDSSQR
ncbi:MAG: EAL domain-containing protein [Myxococcales bacterium]|nr:MAG: EAL domain-containing protein [Myxococcales bacterium]